MVVALPICVGGSILILYEAAEGRKYFSCILLLSVISFILYITKVDRSSVYRLKILSDFNGNNPFLVCD